MSKYAKGKYAKAIDDRTGFKVDYKDLRTEWNGLRVHKDEWEPKHPQLEPRKHIDPEALRNPRPESPREDALKAIWGTPALRVAGAEGVTPASIGTPSGTALTAATGTVSLRVDQFLSVTGSAAASATGSVTPLSAALPSGSAAATATGTAIGAAIDPSSGSEATFATGSVTIYIDNGGWGTATWNDGAWGV